MNKIKYLACDEGGIRPSNLGVKVNMEEKFGGMIVENITKIKTIFMEGK